MQPIVRQVHNFLVKNKKTISVAESCTGGLLSALLIGTPGSSKYFILGIVAYSNEVKKKILKVPASTIAKKGAVSKETALCLAESVRKIANTDFGIGITGIAGPTGGTLRKPIGTVFIVISSKAKTTCKEFHFPGTRNAVRAKATLSALRLLKKFL